MRILTIEDHPKMSGAIQKGLRELGYSVDVTSSGRAGEDMAHAEPYDAVILDLMLPDCDGVEVCRNLRRRGVATPILMLTALAATADKVAGLDAGADDYLAKPFDFDELVARLRAMLRRGMATESALLRHENVAMDLATHRVERAGVALDLRRKEYMLLEYFMRHPHCVLSRAMIGQHVWDMNFNPFSNVIDVYVSSLRRKIDKPFDVPLIHTVVGAGYRFGAMTGDTEDESAVPAGASNP
ncbi:MAG: response regulator transcription factor [Phycisphaeraceae bacterium]|nr:response regulator transcription factor [Phycisphaeraceae bacterium]